MPGVAGGVLGAVPPEAGLALRTLPAALEVALDLVILAAGVLRARLPAVTVCRGVVVVVGIVLACGDVRTARIVLAPVGLLGGRIYRFGDALAGKAAGNGSDDGADCGPDGTGHGTDGRSG